LNRKIDGTMRASAATASLPAGIQISHHDMKHLPGLSRLALRNRRRRAALAVGIAVISIRPRDGRQPGAPAANETRPLGDGEPRLERPIGNLPCGRARGRQRARSLVFQRVGHDGFQDSARSAQRQVIVLLLERAPTIGVRLLDNGPESRGCERTRTGEEAVPPMMQTSIQ